MTKLLLTGVDGNNRRHPQSIAWNNYCHHRHFRRIRRRVAVSPKVLFREKVGAETKSL